MTAPHKTFDAIVIGLGGMGSATLYQLARRGRRVLGIEGFDIGHDMGSSHGVTRIIRLAYHEDPSYVPLLRRAYELWREYEAISGETILHITGSVDASPRGSSVFEGSLRSCEEHGLPYEALTGAELNLRFPGYGLPADWMALLQKEGGFLLPELCIRGYVALAKEHGAEVHTTEKVLDWEPSGEGVRVRTDQGVYEGRSLAITAGAWAASLVPELKTLAVPERQVLAWLEPLKAELFSPERFPVFNVLADEGHFYGFPVYGVPGFKLGRFHHREEQVDPDDFDRRPNSRDEDLLRSFAERYFPDAAGPTSSMKACMFTNSPDEHFIIDVHPEHPQVSIAAGFSGHGFKFSSVVGEIVANLADGRETPHDIGMFRLGRFAD